MKNYELAKARRIALGWTQAELGNRCGVSANTISVFENGRRISDDTHSKIIKVFEEEFNRLGRMEKHYMQVAVDVILLPKYENPVERARALGYINGRISMILTETLREI